MVYTNDGWTLYTRIVHLKDRDQEIFFFTRNQPKTGTECDLPEGYAFGVNKRTGIPYLKRK